MMKSIAFTTCPAADIARASRFYEQALGLEVARVLRAARIEWDIGAVLSRLAAILRASVKIPRTTSIS